MKKLLFITTLAPIMGYGGYYFFTSKCFYYLQIIGVYSRYFLIETYRPNHFILREENRFKNGIFVNNYNICGNDKGFAHFHFILFFHSCD
jgi:hypothetical protein